MIGMVYGLYDNIRHIPENGLIKDFRMVINKQVGLKCKKKDFYSRDLDSSIRNVCIFSNFLHCQRLEYTILDKIWLNINISTKILHTKLNLVVKKLMLRYRETKINCLPLCRSESFSNKKVSPDDNFFTLAVCRKCNIITKERSLNLKNPYITHGKYFEMINIYSLQTIRSVCNSINRSLRLSINIILF